MAKKIIRHDDLFEPKITKGLIKELDDLIKKGTETEDSLKDILKVLQDISSIKTAEEFKDFTKESEKLNKAQKELVDTEKKLAKVQERILDDVKKQTEANKKLSKTEADKLKLLKKLKEANSTAIDDNEIIKVQIQEQNKINKQRAKEALNLISAYEKESKKLNDLRKKYKDLAVQNKENTKEGRELLKNITKLDKKLKDVDNTVGQNQRSVGKYEKALSGLNNTIGKLGLIAVITKAFEFLADTFGSSREGALALQIALSEISVRARVFINNLIEAGAGIKGFFIAIYESFLTLDANIQKTAKKAQLAILKILDKNPLADYKEEITAVKKEIEELDETINELSKSSISDSIDKITEAFDETGKTIDRATESQKEYLELQLRTRIEIEQQEKALAGLAEKRQILQDISDDDTIGFVTRARAIEKAKVAAIEFAKLENQLALTKEKLTIEAVKQDLREANALTERQLAQIQTGEQLKEQLKSFDLSKKVSDANDEAFTAAFVERREKQVESESFRRDAEEKFRKTARDAFEQENDILTEFTELKIAANDKIISSDKATLAERQKAFAANQKLEKELFENSISLIIEQGKASIDLLKETTDLRTDLTAKEKEEEKALLDKRKALLTNAAIQEIINEQDIIKQGVLIRNLDLGEIEEKVLKDTLKLKKELSDASKEAAITEQEASLKTKELQEEILLQERVLAGEKLDIEDERTADEISNLETRIDLLKEDSVERLELERELNDLLIDAEKDKNAKKDKLREDQTAKEIEDAERRKEIVNSIIDETLEAIDRKNEAENASRDAAIEKQETALSVQEERAKKGLTNTLAFEQEQLDKANLERQRELERQAKQQEVIALVQAYLNQFQELSKTEPDTAAFKAFTNTLLAKSVAKGLTGFIEGTELVERDMNGSKFSSGQDGYIAKFDGKERILNPAQNMALPKGMTNAELVQAAQDYSKGNTWGFMPTFASNADSGATTKAIIESNKQVIRAIQDNAASMSVDSEGLMHLVESRVSRGKKELIHFINKKYKMLPK